MTKIFIHGLGQTEKSWNNIVVNLKSSYNDCPNLKVLLGSKEITFSNLYKVFEVYCNNISGQLDLCGISLGGMLALKYTIQNPEKVNSLVLIAVQYKIPKMIFEFQGLVFKYLPSSCFGTSGFTKQDFIILTNSMKKLDFSGQLNKVKCETLIICGAKDIANKKATYELYNKLENAQICLIPNCTHEVNVNCPEELVNQLQKFYN